MKIITSTEHKILIAMTPGLNTMSKLSRNVKSTFAWTNKCVIKLLDAKILKIDEKQKLGNKRIIPLKLTERGEQIKIKLIELERITNG